MDYLDSVNDKRKDLAEQRQKEFLHKQSLSQSKENTKKIVDAIETDSRKTKNVKIVNELATKNDIDSVIKQLKENQLAQLMGNQKVQGKPSVVLANGTDVEDIMSPLADKIDEALRVLANNNKDEKVARQLNQSFNDFAEAISAFMVQNQEAMTEVQTGIEDSIARIDVKPVVNVPKPQVNVTTPEVDLSPLEAKLDALRKSIESIPTPSFDTTELMLATTSVRTAIENMVFPTPNYVLPFKDANGAASQVQLTSAGRLPVELGTNPTIDIGDVQVKNASGTLINPSTEEKQDDLISAVEDLTIAQSQTDVFDQLVTSTRYNQVEIDFAGVDPDAITDITVTKTSGGDATTANGQAVFSTSTGATGGIKAVTNTSVTYRPHAETYASFSTIFTTGVANSYQRIGIYDTNNGFFIGYEGTSFGITIRNATVDTTIARASFNVDTLQGGASSKYTRNGVPEALDPTKDNLYRIRFGWLGASGIFFEVLSPDQEWVTFHIYRVINTAIIPSIANPNLPITLDARKTSGATNIIMYTACWAAGSTSPLQKLTATLTDNTLAQVNRSVITGQTTGGGGGYVNVKVNPSGALTVEATIDSGNVGVLNSSDTRINPATEDTLSSLLVEMKVNNGAYAQRTDDTGTGVTYRGWAVPGTATSAASWRITKIEEVSGDYTLTFADGNNNFDNVWDNRASLSYS